MVLSEPNDLSCVGYKVDLEVPGYSLTRTNEIPNDQRLIGADFHAVRGDCTSLLRINVSILGDGSLPDHADASDPATARISVTLSEGPGSCAAMNCDDVFIVDLDPAPPRDASSTEQ